MLSETRWENMRGEERRPEKDGMDNLESCYTLSKGTR